MAPLALLLFVAPLQEPAPARAGARIAVGESVSGVLSAAEPTSFQLVVDEIGRVTIALESFDFDALLRVEVAGGELLAEDDDSGVQTDARVVLELDRGSTYVLVVSAKKGSGEFALSVKTGEIPALHGAAELDAGIAWRSTAAERAFGRGDSVAALTHRLTEGELRRSRSQFGDALAAYEAALGLARELGLRTEEAAALAGLGRTWQFLGEYTRAQEHHARWLAIARETGARAQEGWALVNLGIVYRALGDYERARQHHEEGLAIAREIEDRTLESAAVGNLGLLYYSLGDYPRARENTELLLALARELGMRGNEARALLNLGLIHQALGEHARARELFEQRLDLARELGDRVGEARALGGLGRVHQALGDPARAAELFEQHLGLARELGMRAEVAEALGDLARAYNAQGDYARARETHEEQLALARELGDRAGQTLALGGLGNVQRALGDYPRAKASHEQQLALARELGDRAGEAAALGGLGLVFQSIGDHARALEHHRRWLVLARELGDRKGEAAALGNLGNVHRSLGDFTRAREYHERCLALERALGDRAAEAATLGNLGIVHRTLGDYARALEYHEQCLALQRELADRAGEARTFGNLGNTHWALDELPRALEYHEQHLALARELGMRAEEARALGSLAGVYDSLGDSPRARELARSAEELLRELGAREARLHPLRTSARASVSMGDSGEALAALEQAEALLDELSANGLESDEASGLRGRFPGLGETAQDFTALRISEAGEDGVAHENALRWGFAAAGRWKGRALLEGIAEHRLGAHSAEALALRGDRREALAMHGAILERVSTAIHDGRARAEVEALREEARAKLAGAERLAARLREVSPGDAALDLPLGASPEDVRGAVLGSFDLLVEYVEGRERLYCYALGEKGLAFLDLGRRVDILSELDLFLAHVREPRTLAGPAEIARAGHALFERLLAPPLAAAQGSVAGLLIVPGATLAALPFEALVVASANEKPESFDDLRFVLEDFDLTYGPSSPVLVELASIGPRREDGKLLLLADPRYGSEAEAGPVEAAATTLLGGHEARALPDPETLLRLPKTREEAFAIAERLAVGGGDDVELALSRLRRKRSGALQTERFDLYLGNEASRARLSGDLRGFAVLHLACHGFVDPERPQRTGIALCQAPGDAGWFTILNALDLDLDANLVVLSACETARGQPKSGEGVESLARAFLYAGARAVVASLWQVTDWAAAETMQSFYEAALLRGLPPAQSLRQAKLALRRSRVLRGVQVRDSSGSSAAPFESGHPFFWAPFIHVGLAR